ncbi:MAG: hypothetical protein CVV64_13700 [Candidatus Wallbacteria bacterium HGW-Wallbacteria-1]|uniref:Uncharacterized protein n=1 Tax=Candidatus Wallbacteria bacterium HGW-Wallbacteria-1 TaxID=2013854 RepID=A0A2N1PMN7_9BACT|nr:MAG: hypothetical protein CVV64_13700 [Candidatus Wallbacteria bacterium HGW-Wallbacteria-1]
MSVLFQKVEKVLVCFPVHYLTDGLFLNLLYFILLGDPVKSVFLKGILKDWKYFFQKIFFFFVRHYTPL